MPVVRCRPEVSVKHQGRRLVVDATTSYNETNDETGNCLSGRISGIRVSSLSQAVSISFRWYLSYALQRRSPII
jgi:hypothetical protein